MSVTMGAKLEMKRTFMSLRLGGREAGQVVALSRQMGLVGVAGFGGRPCQRAPVFLDEGEEAAEAQ